MGVVSSLTTRARAALSAFVTPSKARGARNNVRQTYEAASQSTRALGWLAPTLGPNDVMLYDLLMLRNRSRLAVRNDSYAKGIIDKLVVNIVGTGVRPRSQSPDFAFRHEIQKLWNSWTVVSDAAGRLDFYGQQSQAVRSWLEGGEVFVRLRPRLAQDGLPVPMQLEVIEPELCPHMYNGLSPQGNNIRAGIEFDQLGRRVAYWFYSSRPGDFQDWNAGDFRRVPAQFVIHLYDPLRPGQLRGIPILTQALIRLYELDKYSDATLLRQQIGNLFAGFIRRSNVDGTNLNPLTGLVADDTDGDRPVVKLDPGIMQELGNGEEVQFSDPPDPPTTFTDFMKQQLRAACASTGVPYEVVTGDLSGLNDRVIRVLLHEFRRGIQSWQFRVVEHQLCRPVWDYWMDRTFLAGAAPIPPAYLDDPSPWAAVEWSPHAWPYIHPVQDVEASRAAIRAGFTTRSAVVAEQGEDAEAIDAEQAADNARADELGLVYASDGRQLEKGGAANAPADLAAPAKEDN